MKQKIANDLLAIRAVELRPNDYFTWTSGLKSPIYCDNRLTMSYPKVRREIARGMVAIIQEQFPEVEVIAGTATAGIPHAAWVSELLDLPMVYVRDSAKKHGKTNQIEGRINQGAKVVVIEDLISTGLSSLKVVEALEAAGCEVLGVVAIFSYLISKATEAFKEAQVACHTLTDYDVLINEATKQGYIKDTDVAALVAWRDEL
ncbi:orotate phosphoribosyltransferase [Aerococcaceae bacterium NML191292]|nr:orotate phosphoribosyltransferase [Aerococcaceae bacterium NML210727]MCW6654721.1 orotate phosphoribosyltransferase [Aerococcaceae bacterium NML201296]MCW6658969.1 orotate phosphoribosyltransferase [Aerococcaceae bacterium NML191292]MCW6660730.1 orotate phosphoribosyltransferase [Aerococcaceae bacterium NML201209]MCW6664749.1 orotate phosphoribosyltransferase [Aerococcaceae bacterium NML191219]MCW6680477.1 orotate phosphoribosyltransferase [Aerococcaceae bacterium NML130460]